MIQGLRVRAALMEHNAWQPRTEEMQALKDVIAAFPNFKPMAWILAYCMIP